MTQTDVPVMDQEQGRTSRLKAILKKRHKSQMWLVGKTKLPKSVVSRICSGKLTNYHTNTLKKICEALNVTSAAILGF